jgi:site-specific DNA recombinase
MKNNKDLIISDGVHKPIISQELWDRVRALYAKKGGKLPRIFQGSFPLTGILRWPQCGIGMVAPSY